MSQPSVCPREMAHHHTTDKAPRVHQKVWSSDLTQSVNEMKIKRPMNSICYSEPAMQKDLTISPFKKDYASKSSFCGPAVQEEIFPASSEVLKVFIITASKVTLQIFKYANVKVQILHTHY